MYFNFNYTVFAGSESNGEQSAVFNSTEAPSKGLSSSESQPVGDKSAYSR